MLTLVNSLLESDVDARLRRLERDVAAAKELEGFRTWKFLEASYRPEVVPLKPGVPAAVIFPQPIRFGLKWRTETLSVGRTGALLSLTTQQALADFGLSMWIILEDDSLFELRLVNASSKHPFQTPIRVSSSKDNKETESDKETGTECGGLARLRTTIESSQQPKPAEQ